MSQFTVQEDMQEWHNNVYLARYCIMSHFTVLEGKQEWHNGILAR